MPLNDRSLVRAAEASSLSGDKCHGSSNGRAGSVSLTATPAIREPWDFASRHEPDVLNNGLDDLVAEREQAREVILQLSAEVRNLRSATSEIVGARQQESEDKLMELAKRASDCVAERDALIERLHRQVRADAEEIARLKLAASAAVTGVLSSQEARARMQYETGRIGITTLWPLLMLRSLPVMPLVALLVFFLINTLSAGAAPGAVVSLSNGAGKLYLAASGATLAAVGLATFCGVVLQWLELGPRWIWLRRTDSRARTLEALTSGGEGIVTSPDNLVLELSPIMSFLGLGVVRRRDSGQKYVTTEPDAWLQAPGAPRARRRLGLDLITLASLAAWVVLVAVLLSRY
jgi:hypothetical protein